VVNARKQNTPGPESSAARSLIVNLGHVDRESGLPPFEQIANILRGAIEARQLAPSQRLPTETKLAEHFGVARTTLRRAVLELRREGLLVSASGRGVAVRPTPAISDVWPQPPLTSQDDDIRPYLYMLSGLLMTIADTALEQEDILDSLILRLRQHLDPERSAEVFSALEAARQAFSEARSATLYASRLLRESTSERSRQPRLRGITPLDRSRVAQNTTVK